MRKSLFALIVGIALSTWSTSAWALAYTIASSVAFNSGGMSGTINPVTSLTGTSICLGGVCGNTATHDWLLVTVTLNPGSGAVDEIDISVAGVSTITGAGHFSDPDETPTSGGPSGTTLAHFSYDNPNVSALNLQAGETTDRLFGVWTVGSLPGAGIPPVIPPGTASFMIGGAGAAVVSPSPTALIVVVPEPGTVLLLAGGLLGLALAGRRSR